MSTEKISVKLKDLSTTLKGEDLTEVIIDTNLHLPNMFSILLTDEPDSITKKLTYTDALKLGSEISIEIETQLPGDPMPVKATLIVGEITALEPAFTNQGVELLQIRGYDRSHRLNRGQKTRTFGGITPITLLQIINTIVQETEGIANAMVDPELGAEMYPYVLQLNQTDLEFLWSRAELVGGQVYVVDKTLYFQKADAHRGLNPLAPTPLETPAPLNWPGNLISFYPRLTVAKQVEQAEVISWDPKTKKQVKGTASSDSSKTTLDIGRSLTGQKQTGSQVARAALASPTSMVKASDTVVTQPGLTIGQANAIAKARFAAAESEFIQADGVVTDGDPRLIAGRVVTIAGVGDRFSGDYYVTEARHTYVRGLYHVSFSVTGRSPYTAHHLLSSRKGSSGSAGQIQGVVTAKVVSLDDPERLGRVQVMFPWLPQYKHADLASNWARLASPAAGKGQGFFCLPEVDDEVLVAFEHGDPNYPYIVGRLWNQWDKPPTGVDPTGADIVNKDRKRVNQRIFSSRGGHKIILDDNDGQEQIIIQSGGKKGNSKIILDQQGITIDGGSQNLTIQSQGMTTIESTGDLTFKSKKSISLECNQLNVKATGPGKVEGSKLEISGTSMVEVKNGAGAKIALSGPTVNLN
ncbi:MAG: hypothetical protein D6768_19555 [Chloroflexi bacterium]|nr:MAG: hypothetical protein D6768_19555 [Chloroflexota bacterium]